MKKYVLYFWNAVTGEDSILIKRLYKYTLIVYLLFRIDDILDDIEREQHVETRWTENEQPYQNAKNEVTQHNARKQLLSKTGCRTVVSVKFKIEIFR